MSSRNIRFVFVFLALGLLSTRASAQTAIAYSNTTTFTGFAVSNTGATLIGANTITRLIADDIFFDPAGAPGRFITAFQFSVTNLNTVAVTARPRVRFYADNGSGAPGAVLAGFSFTPISFAANTVQVFNASNAPTVGFVTPSPGTPIWAGITFDNNNGTTGATLAQLNNLGQGTFDPPTLGSSLDRMFQTTAAGDFLVNNPVGATTNSPFAGAPLADFGWQFTVVVPEPATIGLLGLSSIAALGWYIRQRKMNRRALEQKLTVQ